MDKKLFNDLFSTSNRLILATFSKPLLGSLYFKASIRPFERSGKETYQLSYNTKEKAFHKNLSLKETFEEFEKLLKTTFQEAHLFTEEADYRITKKKIDFKIEKRKPSKTFLPQSHNREKSTSIPIEGHLPFWKALGIAHSEGAIKPGRYSKFRQVNRFLELLQDILPSLPTKGKLKIFDYGCGKAYLTFALYHFLERILKREIEIIGIDLKVDVINNLNHICKNLGYNHLQFLCQNIATATPPPNVDLIISLHACDTATDIVLQKAVESHAKAIMAVPCCQHELYNLIDTPHLTPILKHGILKERFSALATDALRALYLEAEGYKTQVLEFIDTEHTPKNIMIRAVKRKGEVHPDRLSEVNAFRKFLGI